VIDIRELFDGPKAIHVNESMMGRRRPFTDRIRRSFFRQRRFIERPKNFSFASEPRLTCLMIALTISWPKALVGRFFTAFCSQPTNSRPCLIDSRAERNFNGCPLSHYWRLLVGKLTSFVALCSSPARVTLSREARLRPPPSTVMAIQLDEFMSIFSMKPGLAMTIFRPDSSRLISQHH
jgi:hypothetical protein